MTMNQLLQKGGDLSELLAKKGETEARRAANDLRGVKHSTKSQSRSAPNQILALIILTKPAKI